MTKEIQNIVIEVDRKIREESWFDFHVIKYDNSSMVIAGGIDLTYYHSLEIIFKEIFYVSGYFNGWHSNTKSIVFMMPDDERSFNKLFEIEHGYQVFIFKTEEYQQDFIIAAKNVSFNTDIVYYYDRQYLRENERVAEFVKK